jgi:uncharacterized membrane protein
MQNPPPPSPHGPTSGPPATTSAGMDKKTAATLSYLAGWVTGLIFLFLAKQNDPDVRYHAAQSTVFFGGLTVLRIVFGIFTMVSGIGFVFSILNFLVTLLIIAGWIFSLYKAWTGNGARFTYPVIGQFITPYAEQLAARV